MTITRRSALLSGTALAVSTALPESVGAQQQPRRGGILTVHMAQEQRILNPALRASTGVYVIASKIMEPLADLDQEGRPVPMLATSWEGTADGKTITVKLREGVTWHDGKPFTSADVQHTAMEMWKKHLNYGTTLHQFLDAVDTPDATTAIFRYSRPMPMDLFIRSMPDLGYIAPKHVYQGTNPLENPANTAPIGTGPFKFVQYERGQFVIADRNPNYWRQGLPYLDRIVWRFITDKAAATAALESGQVLMSNYSSIPIADLDRLKKDPRFEVSTRGNEGQPFHNTIEFNHRRKELADVRVRRAIIHAIDTNFFAENFLYGFGKRGTGPIPTTSKAFYTPGAPDYPFDRKKAEALLDEAGYKRGPDGTRFSVRIVPAPWGEDVPLWATFMQQSLAPVGIKGEIINYDAAGYLSKVYRDNEFDISTGWHIYRADPAISTMVWYHSGSPKGTAFTNQWGWASKEIDTMIDEAAFEIDPAKRQARYPEIVKALNTEAPIWMAIEREFASVTSKRLQNHHNNPRWPSSHWADAWLAS
jgi:peptide/nickel transport system substrate-binding protein